MNFFRIKKRARTRRPSPLWMKLAEHEARLDYLQDEIDAVTLAGSGAARRAEQAIQQAEQATASVAALSEQVEAFEPFEPFEGEEASSGAEETE